MSIKTVPLTREQEGNVQMTLRAMPDRETLRNHAEVYKWTIAHVDYALYEPRLRQHLPGSHKTVETVIAETKYLLTELCKEMRENEERAERLSITERHRAEDVARAEKYRSEDLKRIEEYRIEDTKRVEKHHNESKSLARIAIYIAMGAFLLAALPYIAPLFIKSKPEGTTSAPAAPTPETLRTESVHNPAPPAAS